MTIEFSTENDFATVVDSLRPVQIDGPGRSFCGHGFKRCVRPTEARSSGGLVVISDVVWVIAQESGVARPAMGDILSSDGMEWTVVDVVDAADGSRWTCYGRQVIS